MFSPSECGSSTAQGRAKDSSRAHILSLPAELLYDILDYLPVKDVISFVFCRWDFFLASTDFLKHEVGPSLENLETLTKLFMRYPWPKRWLQCIIQRAISSEPPILRDIDTLMAVHARNLLPEDVFRVTVRDCAECNWPILQSWLTRDHHEAIDHYLRSCPCAIFDTNSMKMTPLHIAVMKQDTKTVETICKLLQNMKESKELIHIDQRDECDNTALSYAILKASLPIVQALVRVGADINRRDRFSTPLMDACYQGDEEIILYLMDCGADIAIRNSFGQSALEYIMIGKSRKKHDLLWQLGRSASQPQLNQALLHAFNTSKEFCPILVQCGADPRDVGLETEHYLSHLHTSELLDSQTEPSEPVPGNPTQRVGDIDPDNQHIEIAHRFSTESSPQRTWERRESDDRLLTRLVCVCSRDEYRRTDAWFLVGRAIVLIVRLGPIDMCTYVVHPTWCIHVTALQDVSDPQSRIPNIKVLDSRGFKRRKYGWKNIKNIVGVVSMGDLTENLHQRAPRTYLKIEWTEIEPTDHALCPGGCSWVTRTEIIKMMGRSLASRKIAEAWNNQAVRYAQWERRS